jgi:hypothetical protein
MSEITVAPSSNGGAPDTKPALDLAKEIETVLAQVHNRRNDLVLKVQGQDISTNLNKEFWPEYEAEGRSPSGTCWSIWRRSPRISCPI